MREIKFRGKCGDEWIYGSLIRHTSISIYGKYSIMFAPERQWSVREDTIGQFTGLKDKNGKDIYEGDSYYADPDRIETVEDIRDFGLTDCREIEVIGNIHDNPELLEG